MSGRARRAKVLVFGPLAFALTLLAGLFTPALASIGDLTYQGCIADRSDHGCEKPAHNSLVDASGVAVSRDGKSVYIASGDGISRFKRSSNGSLTYKGCIADEGAHGCRRAVHKSLNGAYDLAISRDGKSVYVASYVSHSITRFKRRSNGALRYGGCFANHGAHGCKNPPHNSLGDAWAVAVSRDGKSVYVASSGHSAFPRPGQRGGNSITRFKRSSNGALTFGGCIANHGAHGCRTPLHNSLFRSAGVAVSPDDRSVYVVSFGAISRFKRSSNGSLTYKDCIANQGNHDCEEPAHDSLGHAEDVAVSRDGVSVYVPGGSSITYFMRGSNGALTYGGCFASLGRRGCEKPVHESLGYARDVAVSRDGASVYVASAGRNSITDFERDSNGALTYTGCFANEGAHGCETPPHNSLGEATGVAISPNNQSIYVASGHSSTFGRSGITSFERELAAP